MNHDALILYYKILRDLIEMSDAFRQAGDDPDIAYRMKWWLFETEEDDYVLFFNKDDSALLLMRQTKEKSIGHTIAKVDIVDMSRWLSDNYIFQSGNGFQIGKNNDTIKLLEYGSSNVLSEIQAFNFETAKSLLNDDVLQELEFQYSTVHNFSSEVFKMYCLFSLLVRLDGTKEDSSTTNRIAFMGVSHHLHDSVLPMLQETIFNLKTKVKEDLSA